jgi:dTDP-glucose 4,6-dehydratase
MAKDKQARFVLASTSEVYGDPQVHPQPEDYWGHVNPVGPRGVYDEAKRYAEALTTAYRTAHDVDTAIVRIFNTYGERMRAADGRAIILDLAASGHPGPMNIGNPTELTVRRIAEDIVAATGSNSTIEYADRPVDDPQVRRPDTTLARTVLGWEPRVAWSTGLATTVAWFATRQSA